MKNLYRLVYTSSRRPHCTDEEITKILGSCKRNNPGKNITGVLLHSENRFLQYLEGDKDTLQMLLDTIKKDDRHGGVLQRDFVPIDARIFPSWHMGYKDISKNTLDFNTSISAADKAVFNALIEDKKYDEDRGVMVLKRFFELG